MKTLYTQKYGLFCNLVNPAPLHGYISSIIMEVNVKKLTKLKLKPGFWWPCHFYFKAWPAVVRTRQEGKVSHILVFNFMASAGVESNLTLRMRMMVSPKNVWGRISPFAANKKIRFVWEKEEATTFTGLLRQFPLLVIDALKIYSRSCLIFGNSG